MSEQKKHEKQHSTKKEHQDSEGMAQGADSADPSSLKKEIDSERKKQSQQKKAS
jgi:hypothetical protein